MPLYFKDGNGACYINKNPTDTMIDFVLLKVQIMNGNYSILVLKVLIHTSVLNTSVYALIIINQIRF